MKKLLILLSFSLAYATEPIIMSIVDGTTTKIWSSSCNVVVKQNHTYRPMTCSNDGSGEVWFYHKTGSNIITIKKYNGRLLRKFKYESGK